MRADEWLPKPTGGDCVDTEFWEQGNSGFVEGISGRDPDVGFYTFAGKDFGSKTQLLLLNCGWKGGEFAFLSKRDQSAVRSDVKVLITVNSNRPAEILPLADARPKVGDRRAGLEDGVLVIGHNR
jgi:hypothetical protein